MENKFDLLEEKEMENKLDLFERSKRAALMSRQEDIVPVEIENLSVAIVGVGGIGSNLAHVLGSMGVTEMTLFDPDEVGEENVYPGWFSLQDLGQKKVFAVQDRLFMDMDIDAVANDRAFAYDDAIDESYDVVIVSTDTLRSRKRTWEAFGGSGFRLWVDARMGGLNAEVYAVLGDDEERKERYNKRLQGDEIDLPCGLKATAPITKGIIPLMVAQAVLDFVSGREPIYCSMYGLDSKKIITAKR